MVNRNPLTSPEVRAAAAKVAALESATNDARRGYYEAAIRACGSRDAAAEALGLSPRVFARRLADVGLRAREVTKTVTW